MPTPTYTVSDITLKIKRLLEGNTDLQQARVTGEVSNLVKHRSGHQYFSIKDAGAQLSCVLFRGNQADSASFENGDKVVVTGGISVYPPRGNYQFIVRKVEKEGQGDLYKAFLQLKDKLHKEGLFDSKHKKPIPRFPNHIVVLTSDTGAAVKDIFRTLKRRYNLGTATLIPTVVQGIYGKDSIIRGLHWAAKLEADVIILGRGGGSIEDLWNFNEEAVARAIFDCPIPIISGVGHETDFTISDFVADLRASTPTAAAEHAAPDQQQIRDGLVEADKQIRKSLQHFIDFRRQVLDDYQYRLGQSLQDQLQNRKHQLSLLKNRLENALPDVEGIRSLLKEYQKQLNASMRYQFEYKRQTFADYQRRLQQAHLNGIQQKRNQLSLLEAQLKALDQSEILKQGYTLTLKDGHAIKSVEAVKAGEELETIFADGCIQSTVKSSNKNK